MKHIKKLLALAVLMVAGFTVHAQVSGYAIGGAKQTGTNFAVIPQGFGTPTVTFISATGTNANAALNYYYSTNVTQATAANTTTTNFVGSTNGFSANKVVLLYHAALNPHVAYERLIVSASQNTNQIVFTAAPATAVASGDSFYLETVAGTIPVGNATIALGSGFGVATGDANKPLLIDEGGSTNTTINTVNAQYR